MKTVYAPNTSNAWIEAAREVALANPVEAYAVGVVLLAAVCYVIKDWF